MNRITTYIETAPGRNLYVGFVPGVPGAHTQAESLDELQANLKEVLELCLEEMDPEAKNICLSSPASSKCRCWFDQAFPH